VLDAEAHRLAPVPIGLINGTTYRGGARPPLDPFAVLAALRRLLEDRGVPDGELVSMTGPPWSGTDCDLSGDLAALPRGRPVVLRESGRITTTGVPVPQEPADGQPASAQGDQHALVEISGQPLPGEPFPGEPFPAHLVIESLPARTDTSAVAAEIASRAERRQWHGPHADGSITESSTRYPTRLAGIGQWRPTAERQFEGFFEKFAFPAAQQKPTAWVRVEFTATLNDTATEYTADARGVFMTMDREVRNTIPTTVNARRLPWTL
jgi:hypothetical protein